MDDTTMETEDGGVTDTPDQVCESQPEAVVDNTDLGVESGFVRGGFLQHIITVVITLPPDMGHFCHRSGCSVCHLQLLCLHLLVQKLLETDHKI